MTPLTMTLQELRVALDTKQISALDLTNAYLARIEATNPELNSLITVTAEHARARAAHAQKEIDAGNSGPLTGIPYIAKDLFATKGILTTSASEVLAEYVPPYNATVIEDLVDAPMLGKANMDEYAMGTTGEYSAFGATKNPYDLARVPGGSSSGSAASVASGQAPWALGTDTGGSIRLPAGFTHTVGFKPTYGTYSRYGAIAMASSLDTVGTFTRTVEDAAYLLEHLAHRDPLDTTSRETPNQHGLTERVRQADIKGMKFGVPREFMELEGMQPAVKEAFMHAIEKITAAGGEVVEISLPHAEYAINAYYILAPSEVSSNMARYDGLQFGSRALGDSIDEVMMNARAKFGAEVQRRILIGTYTLSGEFDESLYHIASKVRTLIINDFAAAMTQVDAIICPSSPSIPFLLGENANDPLAMWLLDIFTVPMNLAGVPAVTIPGPLAHGLPAGIQCIGAYGRDEQALLAAAAIEKVLESSAPALAV